MVGLDAMRRWSCCLIPDGQAQLLKNLRRIPNTARSTTKQRQNSTTFEATLCSHVGYGLMNAI
jgi:hypothetical protein